MVHRQKGFPVFNAFSILIYKAICIFLLVLICFTNGLSQQAPLKNYPKDYFRIPLNIAPSLAGNFGDLRTNHYHMGLDFRTEQRENLSVLAAADGYISHVRIEPYGYGRAIFIIHPNGYTTVYGHLNSFFPELETYTRQQQYATQKWQQDIDFAPNQFPVRKGQFIALSGNTGGSEGPHLHFEIRDSGLDNGRNRNPLLFGLGIGDNISPVMYTLGVFNRSQSIYENGPQLYRLQKKTAAGETYYSPAGTVIKVPFGKFSLGVNMEDKVNQSFLFGIYKANLYLDSALQCSFSLDECVYEDSRYINAGIDYYTKYNGGSYMQHLSRLPGNHSPYYTAGDGLLQLADDSLHLVEVEVLDVAGNLSLLRFTIQRDNSVDFPANYAGIVSKKLVPNKKELIDKAEVQMVLDENALYDTVLLRYNEIQTADNGISKGHSLGDYRIPLHDSATVRIKPKSEYSKMADSVKSKVMMVINSGKKRDAQRCSWKGGWAEAKWWNFGDFYLKLDNENPTLRAINVYDSAVFVKDRKLVFDAHDETSDLQSFNGFIDGKWIPFRQKKDRYTYDFDDYCLPGWHTLLVKAKDLAGNEAIYECSFLNGAKE